jgi:hypothetical protein
MNRYLVAAVLAVCLCFVGAAAQAATNNENTATKPKIGMTQARKSALAAQPGKVQRAELQKEHGKRIYSFDIKASNGKTHEVNVNAENGKIIEITVESARAETNEHRTEANEKTTSSGSMPSKTN